MANQNQPNLAFTAVVANAGTKSDVVDLLGFTPVGIYLPASLEGVFLKFEACPTAGGTFLPVYGTDGNEVSYVVASSRYVPLDPSVFAGVRFLKIVTDTQTGAYTATLAARRLG